MALHGTPCDFLEHGETLAPIAFVGKFATQQTTPVLIDSRDEKTTDRALAKGQWRCTDRLSRPLILPCPESSPGKAYGYWLARRLCCDIYSGSQSGRVLALYNTTVIR